MLRSLLAIFVLALVVPAFAGPPPTCVSDAQCADGDLCNGIERCVAGTCTPPNAPLVCDDGDACTADSCDPGAGCAHADTLCAATCGPGDDGLRCSDGTACTVGDTCSGGACVGSPLACDDADPCTVDSCNVTLGCTYVEQADPPACLTSAQCASVADHTPCVGDGDPCTLDGCLEGACRIGLNQIVRQCADGDYCNGDEFCSSVKGCEPAPPLVCDDGDTCNGTETCIPASGCAAGVPEPDDTPCDDGLNCTDGDTCTAGSCSGPPLDCADADLTTLDFCIESTGCLRCAPASPHTLGIRFATATKPGKFTLSAKFTPATPLTPTGPGGLDLIFHDDTTVVQATHVPPGAFTVSGGGKFARFSDKTGTVAPGLERLRVKSGVPFSRHQVTARGSLLVPFSHQLTRRFTVRTGSACMTALVSCKANGSGTNDRCQ